MACGTLTLRGPVAACRLSSGAGPQRACDTRLTRTLTVSDAQRQAGRPTVGLDELRELDLAHLGGVGVRGHRQRWRRLGLAAVPGQWSW
jgi:hypothetical protein